MTDLAGLLKRVEEATGADRELDAAVMDSAHTWTAGGPYANWRTAAQAFGWDTRVTSSVDAVLALIGRELPGWMVRLQRDGDGVCEAFAENGGDFIAIDARHTRSFAETPALALLAALIRAKLAGEVGR